jgi:glycerophosphoryl diester phosphodiesterase
LALSPDGKRLLRLLEKPVSGGEAQILAHPRLRNREPGPHGGALQARARRTNTAIGDFQLFADRYGVVIERDDTQGDLSGFTQIFEVELRVTGQPVTKMLAVDLLKLSDPLNISPPGQPCDVGLGEDFSFPFTTIEDVVVLDRYKLGVINDNNSPSSIGRHVGSGAPGDSEFMIIFSNACGAPSLRPRRAGRAPSGRAHSLPRPASSLAAWKAGNNFSAQGKFFA